jgi:hypothetical protein
MIIIPVLRTISVQRNERVPGVGARRIAGSPKRKVVAGIAKDIEKVYGKERLLIVVAGAAIEAARRRGGEAASLWCDLSGGGQGKAGGDHQGASGEGHP